MVAPLSGIARAAEGMRPPAITLVGAVAALHEQLSWYERRPLHGKRVVVTRARAQASGLAAQLEALGAEVVQAPAIRIEPLPFAPPDLAAYDTVCVTSANGAELLLSGDVRALHGVRVAAIGPATVAALTLAGSWPTSCRRRPSRSSCSRPWARSRAAASWWRRPRARATCCRTACANGAPASRSSTSTARPPSRSTPMPSAAPTW